MKTDFQRAFDWVLKWEGGYCNDEGDPAGATNMGITHEEFRKWLDKNDMPQKSIKNILLQEARLIYLENYWLPMGCDKIDGPLDVVLFNAAVNTGIKQATLFLQRAANITADGIYGPNTNKAAMTGDPRFLALGIITQQESFYRKLHNAKYFLRGWLNRLSDLKATFVS